MKKKNYHLNNESVEINFSDSCVTIINSYRIKSDDDKLLILTDIIENVNTDRTIKDMFYEWKTHNVLYKWGLFMERTKNVDLELSQSKGLKFLYRIFAKVFRHE